MSGLSNLTILASLCLVICLAEPPRWQTNTRFSRLQGPEAATPHWKPSARIQWKPSPAPTPAQSYGPPPTPAASYGPPTPAPSYGPPPIPAASYGPPTPAPSYGPPTPAPSYGPPPLAPTYGPPQEEPSLTTTTEISITTEENSESVDVGGEGPSGQLQNTPNGFYYISHPNGLLQKVFYATNNDGKKMSFVVKYEDVEPIRAPVYTYDPETYVLRKVFDPTLDK